MSDEEDYMADSFVTNLPPVASTTKQSANNTDDCICPAVPLKKRRLVHYEQELRDKGLGSALPDTNKGFRMMAQMGYEMGQSVGKSSTQGIVEPIEIQIRTGRAGLGHASLLKQLRKPRNLDPNKKKRIIADIAEFRQRQSNQAEQRQLLATLRKCQASCENLDQAQQIETPIMSWFWPERAVPKVVEQDEDCDALNDKTPETGLEEEHDDEEEEYEPADKVEILSAYLRETYWFCHWCGAQYNDAMDLKENCPGETKDDH